MVILPDPVRRAAARHPLLRALHVTDAGSFPHARGHRVERPQGAGTHLLIACRAGRGWVSAPGFREEVLPGQLVWIPAEAAHAYGANEEQPWSIHWVHFRGEEVESWRKQLGWAAEAPVGLARLPAELVPQLGLEHIFPHLERGYSELQLLSAATALRSSLCAAQHLLQLGGPDRSAIERTAAVREAICRDPARELSLPELASSAGLSVPHFSMLFKRQTGYPPVDFIIRQRIRIACILLDTTHKGIAQIAAATGFNDPYYFSRCFKRVMGVAPLTYRRTVKA